MLVAAAISYRRIPESLFGGEALCGAFARERA